MRDVTRFWRMLRLDLLDHLPPMIGSRAMDLFTTYFEWIELVLRVAHTGELSPSAPCGRAPYGRAETRLTLYPAFARRCQLGRSGHLVPKMGRDRSCHVWKGGFLQPNQVSHPRAPEGDSPMDDECPLR